MADTEVKKNNLELFSYKEITFISSIFIGFWIGVNLLFKFISSFFNRTVGRYWPIGKVEPILPTIFGIIIAAIVFISFLLILKLRSKYEFNLYIVIIIGILLIIGTNIFHGLWKGFVTPTEGSGGITYYWDAIEIEDPLEFLRTFNQRQHKLEGHSRRHPPGAVLLYYFLYKIFIFSALISVAILIISTIFSAIFLYGILKREINNELALYITFLFLLIPAIQIYYLANNYAIITALILGVIYFYMPPNNRINLIGTICCLFLIAFLTFMVIFILGVLLCFETIKSYKNKRVTNFKNVFLISMSLFLIYVVFLVLFNFNYIASFLYASQQENPQGFWLFADPFGYFVSRVENILEILFFIKYFLL